jgi:hypothetical protein
LFSGFFDDVDDAATSIGKLSGWAGVYWTLNPVNPALLARCKNRLARVGKRGGLTSDKDVLARRLFLIDIDAVRPAGISSTDLEHAAALDKARAIADFLAENSWPEPVAIDSGNGGHLLYHINLPNDDASTALAKSALTALAEQFNGDGVTVDLSVYNASRISKVAGSLVCKGDSTSDRPHRIAKIISAPDAPTVIIADQLQWLAAQAAAKPSTPTKPSHARGESFDADAWIAKHEPNADGPHSYAGGRKWILKTCAFDASHTGGCAVIIQHASGAMDYRCLHNSCTSNRWAEYRALREPGYRDRKSEVPSRNLTFHADDPGQPADAVRLKTICMADVKNEPVEWLVDSVIATRAITLWVGDPGLGKSTLATKFACDFSTGAVLMDGTRAPQCDSLIFTAEDSLATTVGPRIDAMGGDRTRIHVIDCIDFISTGGERRQRSFTMADVATLRAYLIDNPATRYIVIDPVSACNPDGVDSHKTSDIRSLLAPLAKLAEDLRVAIVCVTHFTKASGGKALYRAMGSLGYVAAARVAWAIVEDKESESDPKNGKPTGRLFLPIKNNLGPMGTGWKFTGKGAIEWTGNSATDVDDAIGSDADTHGRPGPAPKARNAAEEWLKALLASGPLPVGDVRNPAPGTIRAEAALAAISWGTVRRAFDEIDVISEKCPYRKTYQWRLPKAGCSQPEQPEPDTNNLSNLSNHTKTNGNIYISTSPIGGCAGSRMSGEVAREGELFARRNGHPIGLPDVANEKGHR